MDILEDGFRARRQLLKLASAMMLPSGLVACSSEKKSESLVVGGLPVTCNLTLPVACAAKAADSAAAKQPAQPLGFEYSKYSGFPELKESLMAGRIQAAYVLAPMVMDLVSSNIPVKVVSLGHRSGAVIMVRTDAGYKHFRDLQGKRVAIPSRFAVDLLFLRKMLLAEGMSIKDVELVEMPPPDMPAALYAKAIDAYCTGEPFGAAAQMAGYATPLRMTRNEWPNYICCVLTVREDLIAKNRQAVQDLVNYVQAAGTWMDADPAHRDRAIAIAATKKYFNQDPKILKFVMTNPSDRVTYGDLRIIPKEFDELMQMSLDAGTLKKPVQFSQYVDDSFFKAVRPVAITL
ncbi:ABC transporter substrate-binding protein [Massilia putida]|uniref:ABC transporter substrate-binding protein n=1 Tax=Massilia putida TaxID=1141883 RepID=UPI0009534A19|nr:ABC transporter substrate-binding protein [Massilia putida]